MTKIFFVSPNNPNPDLSSLATDGSWHLWNPSGVSWSYGVFMAAHDPVYVADQLAGLGMLVVPGVNDNITPPNPQIISLLARFGVVTGDKGRDIAAKAGSAHGASTFRPNLF